MSMVCSSKVVKAQRALKEYERLAQTVETGPEQENCDTCDTLPPIH